MPHVASICRRGCCFERSRIRVRCSPANKVSPQHESTLFPSAPVHKGVPRDGLSAGFASVERFWRCTRRCRSSVPCSKSSRQNMGRILLQTASLDLAALHWFTVHQYCDVFTSEMWNTRADRDYSTHQFHHADLCLPLRPATHHPQVNHMTASADLVLCQRASFLEHKPTNSRHVSGLFPNQSSWWETSGRCWSISSKMFLAWASDLNNSNQDWTTVFKEQCRPPGHQRLDVSSAMPPQKCPLAETSLPCIFAAWPRHSEFELRAHVISCSSDSRLDSLIANRPVFLAVSYLDIGLHFRVPHMVTAISFLLDQ